MDITFSNNLIQTTGRTDPQSDGIHFYWAASSALVRFEGTTLSCEVTTREAWGVNCLGLVVDGRLSRVPITPQMNDQRQRFLLAEGLEAGEHTALLFKQLDCSYSFVLHGFSTDGRFLPPPEKPALRLEFYGDSVTSGACVEAVDYVAHTDPCSNASCYDNAWWSYAWQCARLLGAEVHTISQGGIAVLNRTGYFHYPDGIGMEDTWDRLCYFPEAGEYSKWDFSRFIPHAVVFALGQNDHHNAVTDQNDIYLSDLAHKRRWMDAYKGIAKGVASNYPDGTPLVFIMTVLQHDAEWDDAVEEVVQELRQEGLNASHFLFTRNGKATPGHPRIPEQAEMAEELAACLKALLPAM